MSAILTRQNTILRPHYVASGLVYQFQGLTSGHTSGNFLVNDLGGNNLVIDDNTSGVDTITWDNTNKCATIAYNAAGTIRMLWNYPDTTQKAGYVRVESKFSATGKNCKHVKSFGYGYANTPSVYSNCTWSANAGAIPEILYSDSATGGDIDSETLYTGALTGGGAYSRTPHPTFVTTTNFTNDTNWNLWEFYNLFNNTGVAGVGAVNDGAFIAAFNGTVVLKMINVFNAGYDVGQSLDLARRFQYGFGDNSPQSGWSLSFRNLYIAYDKPAGFGV